MELTNPEPSAPEPEPSAPEPEPPPAASAPVAAPPAVPAPGSLASTGEAEAARAAARGAGLRQLGLTDPLPLTIVREYKGKQQKDANGEFTKEAQEFSALGYMVTSQSAGPGSMGLRRLARRAVLHSPGGPRVSSSPTCSS